MARNSKFKFFLQILLMSFAFSTVELGSCGKERLAATKMINFLGFELEKMIDNQDNYFFSPLSISVALAMVYIGARGTTREQMSDALDYNIVGKNCLPNKISENFQQLMSSLRKEGNGYSLHLANGAFIQNGINVTHFYTSNLKKFFHTNIKFLNFDDESTTMSEINKWVSNATMTKIPQLLNEPLDPNTVMVLINGVYFKGLWDLPFNESKTGNGLFHTLGGKSETVSFMVMERKVHISHDPVKHYKILELEYQGGNVSMILILPDNIEEFPQYELTNDLLCGVRKNFDSKIVKIVLPKFSMTYKRELSKDMINLGMEELFSDRADLTGIEEANDLHVSVMVHKAVIEVNERGTEASAISGIGIDGRIPSPEHDEFIANHPFLFYIVHSNTNTIMFSGRLVKPQTVKS